jgi:hypothetical protein
MFIIASLQHDVQHKRGYQHIPLVSSEVDDDFKVIGGQWALLLRTLKIVPALGTDSHFGITSTRL